MYMMMHCCISWMNFTYIYVTTTGKCGGGNEDDFLIIFFFHFPFFSISKWLVTLHWSLTMHVYVCRVCKWEIGCAQYYAWMDWRCFKISVTKLCDAWIGGIWNGIRKKISKNNHMVHFALLMRPTIGIYWIFEYKIQ